MSPPERLSASLSRNVDVPRLCESRSPACRHRSGKPRPAPHQPDIAEARIAAEQLIAPLPRQRHHNALLANGFRDDERVEPIERWLLQRREPGPGFREAPRFRDVDLRMLDAETPRGAARKFYLAVVRVIAERHGERAQPGGVTCRSGGHHGAVDARRQERPDRNIAHQMRLDGAGEHLLRACHGLARRDGAQRRKLPMAAGRRYRVSPAVARYYFGPAAGGEGSDIAVDRQRLLQRAISEKAGHAGSVDAVRDHAARHDAANLAGKHKAGEVRRPIERLDAERIARQQQALCGSVVEGEGEHAFQLGEAIGSPCAKRREENFGVAVTFEPTPIVFQQPAMVIDLAIINEDAPRLLVHHRLACRWTKIENRQALMAETEERPTEGDEGIALPIGATMLLCLMHTRQRRGDQRPILGDHPGYAAHVTRSSMNEQ